MTSESTAYRVGSTNAVRPWVRGTVVAACAVLSLVGLENLATAQGPQLRLELQPQRIISLDSVLLETIRLESQLQGWTMRKLCIDGQAYWIGFSETSPTGISPAFKDGKAEQCAPRAR